MGSLLHDLRQYVAAGTMLCRMPDDELLPDATCERFEAIAGILEQMATLIEFELHQEPTRHWLVDLVHLADECVNVARLSHDVTVVTDHVAPAEGYGDPVLLRRAIGNVLDNASRAVGRSGSVKVRVRSRSDDAFVEIADDGAGFGRIASGSGLGLSTVHAAMAACRGRLEIESGPGPGTTVRLVIPRTRHGAVR